MVKFYLFKLVKVDLHGQILSFQTLPVLLFQTQI